MVITGPCQDSDDSSILFYRSKEDIRLDEEPLLKSGNTERYSGFESLVFRKNGLLV